MIVLLRVLGRVMWVGRRLRCLGCLRRLSFVLVRGVRRREKARATPLPETAARAKRHTALGNVRRAAAPLGTGLLRCAAWFLSAGRSYPLKGQ